MAPPQPAALCPDPRPPRSALPRGALAPHSSGRTARLGNQLRRAGEQTSEEAGAGGRSSQPTLGVRRARERRGGSEAAGGRASERCFLQLLSPQAAATHPLQTPGADSQAPSHTPAPRAPGRWRGCFGSRRAVRAGACEQEAQDRLPGPSRAGLPPALGPALRPGCAQWVHSFSKRAGQIFTEWPRGAAGLYRTSCKGEGGPGGGLTPSGLTVEISQETEFGPGRVWDAVGRGRWRKTSICSLSTPTSGLAAALLPPTGVRALGSLRRPFF